MKFYALLKFIIFVLVFSSCDTTRSLSAQQSESGKSYHTERAGSEIHIDGNFDEDGWTKVGWSSGFSVKGVPVLNDLDTRFKIIYDDLYIYVAIECLDPSPDSIPLLPSPRDNPSNDWIEIDFDANLDRESGYAFVVSPYGVRTDMYISGDDDNFDDRWHPIWNVKTQVNQIGWTAEMKIPFDEMIIDLNASHWGVQLTRHISRLDQYSNWQPMPEGTAGWVSQFGRLNGISDVVGKILVDEAYEFNNLLDPEELVADVHHLEKVLNGIYPDLYRYTSKSDMDALFDATLKKINKPLTEAQFYALLTPIFNAIGDGHSWIRPTREYGRYVVENYKMLPIGVKVVDDNVLITKNFGSSNQVMKGMNIQAINGVSTPGLLKSLTNYISADGYNRTWKLDRISNDFSYYLTFLFGSVDEFKIDALIPTSNEMISFTVAGLIEDDWQRNVLSSNLLNYRTDNWNYHLLNDTVGYLSIYTFARGSRFRNKMDEFFLKIKDDDIEHLIIDVRDNYGGNDVNGKYLYSYLARDQFHYHSSYEVNSILDSTLAAEIDCCISSEELDFLKVVSTERNGDLRLITDFENTGYDDPSLLTSPKENQYDKNLYVIANGGSFSVTSDFVSLVHNNDRGIVVGEETGGGYYGNTSGINKILILPNSKLRANLNLIKFTNHREENKNPLGRGVLPHHKVMPNAADVSAGKDSELIFVLDLIGQTIK